MKKECRGTSWETLMNWKKRWARIMFNEAAAV